MLLVHANDRESLFRSLIHLCRSPARCRCSAPTCGACGWARSANQMQSPGRGECGRLSYAGRGSCSSRKVRLDAVPEVRTTLAGHLVSSKTAGQTTENRPR